MACVWGYLGLLSGAPYVNGLRDAGGPAKEGFHAFRRDLGGGGEAHL